MEVKYLRAITRRIGEYQVQHPWLVLGGVLALTIALLPGLFLVFFDTSNENFLPENDPVVEDLFAIGSDFGALDTMEILFLTDAADPGPIADLRDIAFLRRVEQMAGGIEKIGYVNRMITPATLLREKNNGAFPTSQTQVNRWIEEDERLRAFFSKDYSAMRVTVEGDSFGFEAPVTAAAIKELQGHIEATGLPSGITYKVWGNNLQFVELDRNLSSGAVFTTLLGFLVIFLLIFGFYRSFLVAVVGIVPIVLALLWTVGAMGYIHLPFTVLTTGFIPLVMGLGIDYSIHIVHNTKVLQRHGHKIEDAVVETMDEIGEAIAASMITTAIGFASLLLASLLVTQRLGMTLSLSVFFIFIGTLVIVPPVLVIQDRFKNRK